MVSKNNLKKEIFHIAPGNFNELALDLFQIQARSNPVYSQYLQFIAFNPANVTRIEEIPFLPISFFKSHRVLSKDSQPKMVFKSSGTTGQLRSLHFIEDPELYEKVSSKIFENTFGPLKDYIFLALLPSYLENGESSLVYMVNHFIRTSQNRSSAFLLVNSGEKIQEVYQNRGSKKVLIIGVTFALLQMGRSMLLDVPEAIVMETGGMKGRGPEMTREEVHATLKHSFGVKVIHSEYGMTELLSQAYALSHGNFILPFTMKVMTREINDPLSLNDQLSYGALNVIDLANIDSCAFIATEDIGRINLDGTFTVIGRMDNSEIRGCNLLSVGYS